ncbi:hypothetical protein UlMin_008657 [Ulmus minor]
MPVLTETSTMAEHIKLRRPKNQFSQLIQETDPTPHQIPSIIQSTRCKSTISSLLLSTFSNTNASEALPMNLHSQSNKKKNNFTSATFRGLGCSAGASQQVSVPAVIRTSADWEGKKVRKKKQKKNGSKNKESGKDRAHHQGIVDGSNSGFNSATCVDFQDVWCGPGIGFSTDAAASVDCVVARRNVPGRGKIDGEKINSHRERSCIARRAVSPEPPSFFDSEPDFFPERPGSDVFGARYLRHVRHHSPEDLAEIMMLQRGLQMADRFRDMRLDVDNMSYEELLELGDKIGYVNTGLKEAEIGSCLRKIEPWSQHLSIQTEADRKCTICQEEYEANDDMGKLHCGHSFHIECIRHWLAQKNTCPVCKVEAVARC